MEERDVVMAELEGSRERAAALLRAKLEGVARQVKEAAARTVGELETIIPPDPEALFPLASVAEAVASMAPAAAPGPDLEMIRRLDAGRAQSEVLQELLALLGTWCGPRAILVFRDGRVSGWSGAGFESGDPARGWSGALTESPTLQRVADGVPVVLWTNDDSLLASWFDGDGTRAVVVPMSLRGKVVGALVAAEGVTVLPVAQVQLVTYLAGLLLETLAVRPQVPTPAIVDPHDLTPAEIAPPEEEPAPETDAGVPDEAEQIEIEEEPAGGVEAAAAEPEPEPAAEPEVEIEVETEAASEVEFAEESSAEAVVPDTGDLPEDLGATTRLETPVITTARSDEDTRKHEEAKRFARLLVSEIRLYNEQAVVEGKANNDIYQRLKDDIDRSREMYEQRVPAEVRGESNYFFEELVRTLADGDPDALGL